MTSFRTNHRTHKPFPVYESPTEHARRVLAESGFGICPWCYRVLSLGELPEHQRMEMMKAEYERMRASKYGQGTAIDDYEAKQ
jgi:hypothetical protein